MLMPAPDSHLLAEAKALISQGWKQSHIARQLGITQPTLCRWLADAESEEQSTEMVGTRCAASVESGARNGHTLTNDEQAAVTWAMLFKRSRRAAAEHLISHESCTDATYARLCAVLDAAADKSSDEIWPAWFRRACIVTDEMKAAVQGPKAMMRVEPARPRGRFFIEVKEDGREIQHALFPGAVYKSDDMSRNNPSAEIDPETGLAQVNRQHLVTVDSDSAFLLGFTSVARSKDTYTLEDQADHVLEIVDKHGMPLRWMIERGPWDNDFWWGCKMQKTWWHSEECPSYRFGGIDTDAGGPIKVMQAFKPRHKSEIEGAFDFIQALDAQTHIDIGRTRGEYEDAAKKLARVQSLKPGEKLDRLIAQFPTFSEAADSFEEVLRAFNSRPKRRRSHGGQRIVPAELWAAQKQTRAVPADQRWRFMPVKKALQVANAHIHCSLEQHKGREFWFSAEGFAPTWDWQPYLPHGWRVFAVFHPHQLHLGCHIFNAVHPDSPKNPGRFPLGMPLGVLPLAEYAPHWREGAKVEGAADPFADRKQWHKTIRRETRAITASRTQTTRASFAAKGSQAVSARKGSPDPLRELHKGAPPVAETAYPQGSRSGADHIAGSGERGGRTAQDHEAQRNRAGSLGDSASRLAELEAELAEL